MRAGTRPHAATARASERAHVLGSIWLLLAQKTCEMKRFAGTQAVFVGRSREGFRQNDACCQVTVLLINHQPVSKKFSETRICSRFRH